MIKEFPVEQFEKLITPFYYYDLELLEKTLKEIQALGLPSNWMVHYALKANSNPEILRLIASYGFGADCVSGGEVQAAIDNGFSASKIVFAGVGKADWEINLALEHEIEAFNVESLAELEVINELAGKKEKIARVALRVNPDVEADTHKNIKTGNNDNKFGINQEDLPKFIDILPTLENIQLMGLHVHIGSQILNMDDFKNESLRVNEIVNYFKEQQIYFSSINVGGGLGINYENPKTAQIPNFKAYFDTFRQHLIVEDNQSLHFELGRSIVAQCGTLISKVLYVKEGGGKQFAILDAGMTELIRPALYQAFHKIVNLSSDLEEETYDVVGPICESSDIFVEEYKMNRIKRGDLVAIQSAGAYGEVMASQYNMRKLPKAYYNTQFDK